MVYSLLKKVAPPHEPQIIPKLPNGIRILYDLSCFTYLPVSIVYWRHGTRGFISGRILLFMLPVQVFLSYAADSVEFLSQGRGGKWQTIDSIWATGILFTAITFVRAIAETEPSRIYDINIFWMGLSIGAIAWVSGVMLLNSRPHALEWSICHIIWHFAPAMCAINLFS